MELKPDLEKIKYSEAGLIPAVIQDVTNGQVLMLAYMNRESLKLSLETGETHFYSRSRQELWHKGETSGHGQKIKSAYYDCDQDTLLFLVEQQGVACHTGAKSCFHHQLLGPELPAKWVESANLAIRGMEPEPGAKPDQPVDLVQILAQVFVVIKNRQQELPEGSYTTYLFQKGQDKILKKIAEEAGEVIIGSKNGIKDEVVYETADLLYHLLVLLAYHNLSLEDIGGELAKRR